MTANSSAVLAVLPEGSDGAGFLAFAVVGSLMVAGVFLYRSLSRHLNRIAFVEEPAEPVRPGRDGEAPAARQRIPPITED